MKDEKQYKSFVIGINRNRNTNKVETVVIGNKQQGKPADIVMAYAGPEAQALYNMLIGRQIPEVKNVNPSLIYSRVDPDKTMDNRDTLI